MLIVELTYKKPLADVERVLQAHRDFLQRCYDRGLFLASGPKIPRVGGLIIAITDKATMEGLIEQDPFYLEGVAEYKITEFEPVKHCAAVAGLLKK